MTDTNNINDNLIPPLPPLPQPPNTVKCDCCRTPYNIEKVIKLKDVYICAHCFEHIHNELNKNPDYKSMLGDEEDAEDKVDPFKDYIDPKELVAHLDQYIIGQDEAKKILSIAVANHCKRVKRIINPSEARYDVELEKANVLMLGPSGTGKTAILKALSKKLNIPLAIIDASGLTEAGFVGADVDTAVQKLYVAANRDVKATEFGIIYIDEFDKLARKSGENSSITSDPGREGVQQALLKLVEGVKLGLSTSLEKSKRVHPDMPMVEVDTSNILFICGGAFEGIDKIVSKRINKASMGFSSKNDTNTDKITEYNDLIQQVETDDMIKYGIIPELLGRLPIKCALNQLTEQQLLAILTEPKNAIMKQFKEIFAMDNIFFRVTERSLLKIANLANKNRTGARALRSLIEPALLDEMYNSYKGPLLNNKGMPYTIVFDCVDDNLKSIRFDDKSKITINDYFANVKETKLELKPLEACEDDCYHNNYIDENDY